MSYNLQRRVDQRSGDKDWHIQQHTKWLRLPPGPWEAVHVIHSKKTW